MSGLISRFGRWLVASLVMAGILGAMIVPSSAVAARATAWQIGQAAFPTNLAPGSESLGEAPKYELFVTNVGGAPSVGGVTVTDTLPNGVIVSPSAAPSIRYLAGGASGGDGTCSSAGQVVTCEVSATIAAGGSLKIGIPVAISSTAPPSVQNEATVEGGGDTATSTLETVVSPENAPFGILGGSGLSAVVADEAGNVPTAGSEPFVTTVNIAISKREEGGPSQAMRSVSVSLPQGLVVNPRATTVRCKMSELALGSSSNPVKTCPPESQVGQSFLVISPPPTHTANPIYNMVPPPGVAAELAFETAQAVVVIQGGLGADFRLTAASTELLSRFNVSEVALTLWGDPSDARHNVSREGGIEGPAGCLGPFSGCAVAPSPVRFLDMPTSCTEPLEFTASVGSWLGSSTTASRPLSDRKLVPASVSDCGNVRFEPTIKSQSTTAVSDSPAGLEFGIHQPQDQSPGGRSTAALKDVTVTLPAGMTLNAAAANGLDSCTESQMGYQPEGSKIRFATTPQSCPAASKVGTLEVSTPLLETKLPGSVYVAKPFDNPFGSLLAVYLAIEDEQTGIIAKLAGKVEPNPTTGQLTARFTENPELPIEDIDVHFFSGDRATLMTPLTCGSKTTTANLVPWSTPEGADVTAADNYSTSVPALAGACPATEDQVPVAADFSAGTTNPLSGAYSPFVLRISRPDGSQRINGMHTTLPAGLLGRLAGIPYCSESSIAAAKSREAPEKGKEEQASPSCPAASEVGTVQVTAGAGKTPIPVSGHAYLAGPYKGAKLSLVIIVPAVAGPFDLGTVVNRVALNLGEFDARIDAVSDPLPTILDGIPLDVRSIEVKLDRPDFVLNPTSCEVAAITGSVTTTTGQNGSLSNRFQVGECGRLAFKPHLKVRLTGATRRTGHPALKAVVTYPKQGAYANIARAQVGLPHSEFLDQGNLDKVCTRPQLSADACPAKSIYGHAKAWSPLLDKPLEGPVYLGVGFGYKLPALVADLNGQVRILLKGKVDTTKQHGIRNTFEAVPDAPVSRFVLELKGGKKYGLLENSENICRKPQRASVGFRAQNGRVEHLTPKIGNSCKKKVKHKGKSPGHGKHRDGKSKGKR